jgi:hypothetical protein
MKRVDGTSKQRYDVSHSESHCTSVDLELMQVSHDLASATAASGYCGSLG